ncbi:CRISPR-associated protein Cas4 [Caldalkalibacillus thermarum TA2.A1]|uniref:CRISPR-associated exonuclease Cas4 n=1 Tax=Caldalkalibacillus thermarum (strain TA2.A1) TaxID=986075 RepID=F5L3W3_CALTT|nr:CRISPR-associated protein Cas4 [Caldalkalibacillus thermarum]EGL83973.1 CRISPR-associated protein Cas4 [Caldalkalibacillus thermarum TA2.A1]
MERHGIGGVHIHYYALCKRKLWLYDKGITLENEHDRVLEGKVVHDKSYPYLEQKEILIDNAFKIDAIDGEYVREVKISSKMTEADRLQMLFYLYQLDLRGIRKKGLISYTKERRTEEIELTEQNKKRVRQVIAEVMKVLDMPAPPAVKRVSYCTKCAYYGFCYAMERDEE